ncbi:MAG: 3-dehydroquinate synthase II [Methanobacteriota archaeon]
MKKLVWVRADGDAPWAKRKKIFGAAIEGGADAVWVNSGEEDTARNISKVEILSDGGKADIQVGKDAFYKKIHNKQDEQEIVREGEKRKFVIVDASDWKIIPLENIIAGLQNQKAKIMVEVSSPEEAAVALQTLEVGADGVLINGDPQVIKKTLAIVEDLTSMKLDLTTAKVTKIKPVGMGDRVCVDTASMFSLGEGLLVGSASNALFLVHSETLKSEYVGSRPFRVNAGAVHAYTLLPTGKTSYLSEVAAGDEVLAVDYKGKTRKLVVGRAKIEKRPLLLVEADAGGKKITTLLQNAETIMLTKKSGKPISVSKLQVGDEVLTYLEEGGRHFGMKINESIKEK